MALPLHRLVATAVAACAVLSSLTGCAISSTPSDSASPTGASASATPTADVVLTGTGWTATVPPGWARHEFEDSMDAAVFFGETNVSIYGDLPQGMPADMTPQAFRDSFGGTALPDRTIGGEKAYGVDAESEGRFHRVYVFSHQGKIYVLGLVSDTADLSHYDAAFGQACESFAFTA